MKKLAYILLIISVTYLLSIPAHAGTVTASGVTAGMITDYVQNDLEAESSTYWSDAMFHQWIDEAVTEVVNRTGCMEEAVFTFTLVANDYDYAITTSYVYVEAVWYDSGVTTGSGKDRKKRISALDRERLANFGRIKEEGRPKVYNVWNDVLTIWPIPTSTEAGTSVYVYAVTTPSGVTTSTSPIETPAPLDPAIINYVKAKALFRNGEELKGQYFMGLFNESIKFYLINVLRRNQSDVK